MVGYHHAVMQRSKVRQPRVWVLGVVMMGCAPTGHATPATAPEPVTPSAGQVKLTPEPALPDGPETGQPTTPPTAPVSEAEADRREAAPASAAGQVPQEPELPASRASPSTCSYAMYNWSVTKKRAMNRRTEEHDYATVAGDERDPNDDACSLCEQDQVEIDPAEFGVAVKPFKVCWAYADKVREALAKIADSGEFDIVSITGYRPGRTRGRVEQGLRMELSNHSYGTAIDINARYNGLYRRCGVAATDESSIQNCTLGVGGAWRPRSRPRVTVTPGGVVVTTFTEDVGWKWGGAIEGRTKDFMHFSLTGY